jgi:L-asparaginase
VPRVSIVTTGGTIASRRDRSGGAAVASDAATALVAAVPALADVAEVTTHEAALVNSWNITPAHVTRLADTVTDLVARDAPDGIVITHGTDTMEETAFALALLTRPTVPIVLTGAMRAADAVGTDGPRNLLEAVTVATDPTCRDIGVCVVMNGTIHAARHVTKSHTTALDTFASPDTGPVGTVDAAGVVTRWRPAPLPHVATDHLDAGVDVVTMWLGTTDRQLRAAAGQRGLVLAGSGSGNIGAHLQPALQDLIDAGTTVVLTSRCGAGRVVPAYGGQGGGATLVEDVGVVPAGDLRPAQARIALMALLGSGADDAAIRRWFAASQGTT